MPITNRFFVITGGPSSGKTTLIEALKKRGYLCVDEVARSVLQEQEALGTDIKSFRNTLEFADIEFQRSVANYMQAQQHNTLTFFDRGIPDIIAHSLLRNVPVSAALDEAARTYRYNKTVFVAPPWCEIYCTDKERTESYEDSIQICNKIKETYEQYGYSLVELPRADVQTRVQYVLDTLKGIQKHER